VKKCKVHTTYFLLKRKRKLLCCQKHGVKLKICNSRNDSQLISQDNQQPAKTKYYLDLVVQKEKEIIIPLLLDNITCTLPSSTKRKGDYNSSLTR